MDAPMQQPDTSRNILKYGLIAGIILVLLTIPIVLYALALKADTAKIRENTTIQKDIIREQLEVAQASLEEARRSRELAEQQIQLSQGLLTTAQQTLQVGEQARDIAAETRDLVRRQVAISEILLQLAQRQDQQFDASIRIQQQILNTANATHQEVREINERFQAPPNPGAFINDDANQLPSF